jgi:pimeloyl-ACP methyl ester carboxylesterase
MQKLPVLLLPGTLCTGAIFERQAHALRQVAPSVNVVQFLYEGSIDEMADLVARHISRDTGAAIVGFSMGGMVAMALARLYPDLLKKLALLNTNFHAELPERHAARMKHLADAKTRGIVNVVAKQYIPQYLHLQDPAHRQLLLNMAKELGTGCFEAQLEALATRPDSEETLRGIECPTLILGSDNDVLCPPEQHLRMHRMVRDSDLVLLGSCGHFSTLEQPDAVNSALVNWYSNEAQSR